VIYDGKSLLLLHLDLAESELQKLDGAGRERNFESLKRTAGVPATA